MLRHFTLRLTSEHLPWHSSNRNCSAAVVAVVKKQVELMDTAMITNPMALIKSIGPLTLETHSNSHLNDCH